MNITYFDMVDVYDEIGLMLDICPMSLYEEEIDASLFVCVEIVPGSIGPYSSDTYFQCKISSV